MVREGPACRYANAMPDSRDFVELGGVPAAASAQTSGRPWLGVRFRCSNTYIRVFRNAAGTSYDARCPKCGRCMQFRVGQGGTNQRFFEVSC